MKVTKIKIREGVIGWRIKYKRRPKNSDNMKDFYKATLGIPYEYKKQEVNNER